MKFIDEAIVEVIAGDGGKGCASFRREKYVPKGGPDGGDGGRGGSVIFRTDGGLTTLMDVKFRHRFKAQSGGYGKGKQMTGLSGEDVVIRIPVGTVVFDDDSGEVLFDLDRKGADWIAAKGGKGGLGNMHFASSTHQAPREFTEGRKGEQRRLRLELKLLADVGLVGLPNAGKSTLISSVSNARPKIADYPFTTITPCLGLVKFSEEQSFVMADIPGLIEGAHDGAGMGVQFLKHIERTRVLVHLIDVTDPAHPDPVKSYKTIRRELKSFKADITKRPEIVVLTKMDITEAREVCDDVKKKLKKAGAKKVLAVSAPVHEGLTALLGEIAKSLSKG
ncbi:MAG: GTPase ObgE [Pseudomonadota bacterium]